MNEGLVALGVAFGLVSYTSLYLGKGVQKRAVDGLKVDRRVKSRHSALWLAGTAMTALPTFLQWAALLFAPVNLIAPLEGVGLIALFVFSTTVLHEEARPRDLAGAALIVVGVVGIAVFSSGAEPPSFARLRMDLFVLVLAATVAAPGVGILLARRRSDRVTGVLWGLLSGVLMAFQTATKRLSVLPEMTLGAVFLTFLFTTLTLVTTQVGFLKAGAARVVPAFTAASVPLAALLGVVVLAERLVAVQVAGIGAVVAGMLLIAVGTRRRRAVSDA